MRTLFALLVALGMVIGVSGMALAGSDMEGCGAASHQAQTATDKVVKEQPAPASTDKAATDKVVIAQTQKPAQPAVDTKK